MNEYLVDTNVVVYAYDGAAPRKQERALAMVRRLVANGRGRLSTQVLGEFYRATTRKLTPPLSPAEAHDQVALLAEAWMVLPVTPLVVLEATRGVRDHGLAYWDAQLWATARLNQIDTILTENFTDGRILDGVRFVDPFVPAFDVAALS
jgi:predicted nucleic acid-binding protein